MIGVKVWIYRGDVEPGRPAAGVATREAGAAGGEADWPRGAAVGRVPTVPARAATAGRPSGRPVGTAPPDADRQRPAARS